MKQVDVLSVKINALTASGARSAVKDILVGEKGKKIAKVNTEFLLRAQKDKEFRDTLDGFDINIADGKGVLWAAKYLSLPLKARKLRIANCKFLIISEAIWQMVYSGASLVFYPRYCRHPIKENIPGIDAMYLMLEAAKETDLSVYIFGAERDVLEKSIKIIQDKYPKLKIAGYHEGYNYKDEEVIRDINSSGARLLIVALGSPKQEYWIRDNMSKLENVRVAVGEGGSLDFVAGTSRRAPRWMQRAGVEWLWRLFANRSRSATGSRAKRVWQAVPVFIYEVVKWKVSKDTRYPCTISKCGAGKIQDTKNKRQDTNKSE